MTNEDGAALAAAWNSWCESTEGQKCLNADTLCTGQHEYLKNRLWRAFMDGAALRSPAPGAAAMREACLNAVRKCNVIGSRGSADGWFGGVLAALEQVEADIRALPAPEVPEAVKAWAQTYDDAKSLGSGGAWITEADTAMRATGSGRSTAYEQG